MFKQTTLTVALLATGLFASSGYTLAQQDPTTTTQPNSTTTTQPNPATTTQQNSTTTTQQDPTTTTTQQNPTTTTQQNPTTTTQQNPTTTTQQNPTNTTQQDPTNTTQQNPTTTTQPTQQNPTTTQTTPQNPVNLNAVDRDFMIKAAQANMGEIILGRLAAERAVNASVRQYGQRMVQEHTQANAQLMQIAAQKGVTLPTDTDAKHKALRARLGQIPGLRFDRTFMQTMINNHSMSAALFQRESRLGRDADVKAFASTTLPVVRNHLQMAIAMRDNLASR
ncbi:MAG TPA: DUF4142 domain-containing protein [Oculatellaceae cyanobacterium]|jgi:putative membrane protein